MMVMMHMPDAGTVPLKSKLTVSTLSSKFDSHISNICFEMQELRIGGSELRNKEFSNKLCKLEKKLEEIIINF